MMARLSALVGLLLGLTLLSWSCDVLDGDDAESAFPLVVTLSTSGPTTSPAKPVTLTVNAINVGLRRVVWDHGSSTCQLHAVVEGSSGDRHAAESRLCTTDVVEQGLDPGESRSEQFAWSGAVVTSQGNQALPPGTYVVRGAAGGHRSLNPAEITVSKP